MMSEVAYLPVSLSGIDRHAPHAHNSTQHPPPASTTLIKNASPISTPIALEAEQFEDTHHTDTDTPLHDLDASITMTVGGEPGELGSTTMAERTLVEDEGVGEQEERGSGHSMGGEGSGLTATINGAHAHKKSLGSQVSLEEVHDKPIPSWVPNTTTGEGIEMQERGEATVMVVEEEDIVDSKGKLLFPDGDTPAKLPISRRGSHLKLDLKPPSPLPWEQVGPPLDNNLKAVGGYYSPATSRFRVIQGSG